VKLFNLTEERKDEAGPEDVQAPWTGKLLFTVLLAIAMASPTDLFWDK
jgi:hypothetical protein